MPEEESGDDHITDEESGSSDDDIAGHADPQVFNIRGYFSF